MLRKMLCALGGDPDMEESRERDPLAMPAAEIMYARKVTGMEMWKGPSRKLTSEALDVEACMKSISKSDDVEATVGHTLTARGNRGEGVGV